MLVVSQMQNMETIYEKPMVSRFKVDYLKFKFITLGK